MAPTRPLVTQQIGACNDIVGIPQNEVAELLGTKSVADRKRLWATKRVFYCTPQILNNDLKNNVVDPKRIICLVVDECHRAQGDYAYTIVLKQLLSIHHHFRVLGLSATPGTDIEKVQKVIQNLDINLVCIRSRDDEDVKKYLKEVLEEEIVVKLNGKYTHIIDEWIGLVNAPLNRLCNLGVLSERNARKINKMMLLDAQTRLMEHRIPSVSGQRWSEVMNDIGLLMSLTQATQILMQYGVGAFVETLASMRQDLTTEKPNPAKVQFITSSSYVCFYNKVFQGVRHHEYVHPKLEKLKLYIEDHLRRHSNIGRETRVIVFAQFRSSVQEILSYLRGNDLIRATAFVGQQKKNSDVGIMTETGEFAASSERLYDLHPPAKPQKTISAYFSRNASGLPITAPLPLSYMDSTLSAVASGQSQKQQQQILKDFKEGKYNVLVATCIAEEGLDIGEVDLLICYEGISSPTRLLQRKGRTGRKRAGRVVILMTEGSEYQKHKRSVQKYNQVTNFLKTKASSLQLCPRCDTLFMSSFSPQLVQEQVNIREYHYSQIGGHTPKKRKKPQSCQYEHSEYLKQKETHFFESIRGEHILAIMERNENQGGFDMLGNSQVVVEEADPVHHTVHSSRSSLLFSISHFVLYKEWMWRYSNEKTIQWINEVSSQQLSFNQQQPISLQGGFSDSSDTDNSIPHLEPGMTVFEAIDRQMKDQQEKDQQEKKQQEDFSILSISSDETEEELCPSIIDSLSELEGGPLSSAIVPTEKPTEKPTEGTAVVTPEERPQLSLLSTVDKPMKPTEPAHASESVNDSDSDDVTIYELITGKNKQTTEVIPSPVPSDSSDSDDVCVYELLTGKKKEVDPVHSLSDSEDKPLIHCENIPQGNQPTQSEMMEVEESDSEENHPILPTNQPSVSIKETIASIEDTSDDNTILPNDHAINSGNHGNEIIDSSPINDSVCKNDSDSEDDKPIAVIHNSHHSKSSEDQETPSRISNAHSTLESSSNSSHIIALLNSSHLISQERKDEVPDDSLLVQPPPLTRDVIDSLFPRKKDPVNKVIVPTVSSRIICPLCFEECSTPESLRDHVNHSCRMLKHSTDQPSSLNLSDSPIVSSPLPSLNLMNSPNRDDSGNITNLVDHISHPSVSSPRPLPNSTNPDNRTDHIVHSIPSSPLPSPSLPVVSTILPSPSTESRKPLPPSHPQSVYDSVGMNSEDIDRLLEVDISIPPTSSSSCSICHDPSSSSPLLCCIHCGVAVHASCYGVPVSTLGSKWHCDSCKMGLYPVTCALCGKEGGGMKLSTDGVWAHVICVTWNPSLFFVDNNLLKPSNIRPLLRDSPKRTCCLCNKNVGITVKCYNPGCDAYFHVSCAQDHGYDLDAVSDVDGVVFIIQCKKHSSVQTGLISDTDLFSIADEMEERWSQRR